MEQRCSNCKFLFSANEQTLSYTGPCPSCGMFVQGRSAKSRARVEIEKVPEFVDALDIYLALLILESTLDSIRRAI